MPGKLHVTGCSSKPKSFFFPFPQQNTLENCTKALNKECMESDDFTEHVHVSLFYPTWVATMQYTSNLKVPVQTANQPGNKNAHKINTDSAKLSK